MTTIERLCGQPATGSRNGNVLQVVVVSGLLFFAGTGGMLSPRTVKAFPAQDATASSSGIVQARVNETNQEALPHSVKSLADRVSTIKAAFGLTVTQLARVLHVERQTIYDWMDEEHTPQLQASKQARLSAIERWASQWNEWCQWPISKDLITSSVEGHSLLELLVADEPDEERLTTVLRGLSEQVKDKLAARKERSLANRLRVQGFQPVEQSLQDALIGICGTVSLNDEP